MGGEANSPPVSIEADPPWLTMGQHGPIALADIGRGQITGSLGITRCQNVYSGFPGNVTSILPSP